MGSDGADIDCKSTDPKSSSAESDEKQGDEEDPVDDEPWDLPTITIGDIISVKVMCPMKRIMRCGLKLLMTTGEWS